MQRMEFAAGNKMKIMRYNQFTILKPEIADIEGKFDFDETNAKYWAGRACGQISVGIFAWARKSNPKAGFKKTKAVVRVRAWHNSYEALIREANKICDQLDAGTYKGRKNVTIGIV